MRKTAAFLACVCLAAGVVSLVASCSSSDDSSGAGDASSGDEAVVRFDSGGGLDVATDDVADAADASACAPMALASPPTYKPPRAPTTACTRPQIDAFVAGCLTSPTAVSCQTFQQANGGCYACLDSTSADPTRGPVVYYADRGFVSVNVSGCFGIVLGDTSADGCGAADELLRDCDEAACETSCKVGKANSDLKAFAACKTAAEKTGGPCASYVPADSTKCQGIIADASAVSVCYGTSGETFEQRFTDLALLFCGGASDAGAD